MTVLLVTPLQKEMDAFLRGCAARGHESTQTSIGRLPVAQVDSLHLTVALGGNGKVQFAVQTQHLLDSGNNWHAVICAGTCGALAADVSVSDVVIGTETIEHDYYNRFNEHPTPSFAGDPDMLAALRAMPTDDYSFNLLFGPIASGDDDIVDPARSEELQRNTGALVVAWEGAGGARAFAFSQLPYLEIRAATDTADPNAPTDFYMNVPTAMDHIAEIVVNWLSSTR